MIPRVGRNILSLALSRIISGVILFFVYVRAITYLGPEEFGKFSLVLAYYTIFLLLVDFGISKYVIKKVSEDKNLAASYLGNYLVAQFILGLIAFGIFFLIPRLFDYETSVTESMILAGLGLLVTSLSMPYAAIVQAWQRIRVVAGVNFLNTLVNALWLGLAIILRQNIQFIFLLYIILGVLNLMLYAYFARQRLSKNMISVSFCHSREGGNPVFRSLSTLSGFPRPWSGTAAFGKFPKISFEKKLFRSLFIFGAPFAFISGFEILIQKLDVIIQKHFLPYAEVGLYSGAYRFVDFLTFIPAVVAISLFPFVAAKSELRTPEVREMLSHVNRFLVAIALPLGIGATLAADKIILTLFDERFLGSVRPFQVLIWSTVLTLIYAVPNVIMLVKRTRAALLTLGLATLFNAAANWIFVPRYGIMASAWITVISYVLISASYIYFAKKVAEFTLVKHFLWPLAASAFMGLVIYLLRGLDIFSLTAISAVVYFGVLYAVRFVGREDWRFVKSVFTPSPPPSPARLRNGQARGEGEN